jgi:hypothetical protein
MIAGAALEPIANSTCSIVVRAIAAALAGARRQICIVAINPFQALRVVERQALQPCLALRRRTKSANGIISSAVASMAGGCGVSRGTSCDNANPAALTRTAGDAHCSPTSAA